MNYTATRKKVKALLKKNGRSATLRVVTAGAYNPATGGRGEDSNTDTSCYVVLTQLTKEFIERTLGLSIDQDDRAKVGDMLALVDAESLSAEPKAGNLLIIGTDTWRIVAVGTVQPGETDLLHKCHVRL